MCVFQVQPTKDLVTRDVGRYYHLLDLGSQTSAPWPRFTKPSCWTARCCITFAFLGLATLPETNSSHLKIGHPKRKLVFQPSIFRGYVSLPEGMFCTTQFLNHSKGWTRITSWDVNQPKRHLSLIWTKDFPTVKHTATVFWNGSCCVGYPGKRASGAGGNPGIPAKTSTKTVGSFESIPLIGWNSCFGDFFFKRGQNFQPLLPCKLLLLSKV